MELDIILRVLAKKWRIILPIFIITVVASVIFTMNQPRIYEAKATYVAKLSPVFENDRDFANVLSILSSRVEISTTYAQVANSRRLYTLATLKLGLSPENRQNLSVSSRLIPGTNIIEIAVQGTDPILVRDFANAVGESTIEYVRDLYETFTLAPLDEAVTPRRPIQPKTTLNLILGAVLGLALGAIIAFLAYYMQNPDKHTWNFHNTEETLAPGNLQDSSIMELQQGLMTIQAQFETTQHELDKIQADIRSTNRYTKDIRSVLRELEAHYEGNHRDAGKVASGEEID